MLRKARILAVVAISCTWRGAGAFALNPPIMSAKEGRICTIYDFPVSNHGARCRYVVYAKNIEDRVKIASPADLGGAQSEEYLKISPQGKSPAFVTEEGVGFSESDTIARYLVDRFADAGPPLRPASLIERTLADQLCRLHDVYISPIQGCMYKGAPPFGPHDNRLDALEELRRQLKILATLVDAAAAVDPTAAGSDSSSGSGSDDGMAAAAAVTAGPFLAGGAAASLADATWAPTFAFMTHMLPKFGWTTEQILPSERLQAWWRNVEAGVDPAAARVVGEIRAALQTWNARGRWDEILYAGRQDDAPPTVFDGIIAGTIPSTKVYEDDKVLGFNDINPVAATHVLFVPKRREGLTQLRFATAEHRAILGRLLEAAAAFARREELVGYQVQVNDGKDAGQVVFHLHVHLTSKSVGKTANAATVETAVAEAEVATASL